MKKIYFLLICIVCFAFSSTEIKAQSSFGSDQKEVSIYPNPASGNILNVSTKSGKSVTCTVFNVLGKMVLFKAITNQTLDISSLTSGVYILRFKFDDRTFFTKKLIKR